MLIHEGNQRTPAIDVKLAVLLAGIAGALNASGFQAAGFFSANMTGNVSALSDQIGLGRFGLTGIFLALIVAFITGAFCSGLLIETGRRHAIRGIYAYSILLEAALLAVLAVADLTIPSFGPGLLIGLSFIMGLQNAATTRISDARVRTTHVSGMATDIGLALASLTYGNGPQRLKLHLSTLVAFLLGGIAGVVIYLAIGGWLFLLTALLLLVIALPEVRRARA